MNVKTSAGILLLILGSTLAWYIQTGSGEIELRDVRFATPEGRVLSGLLYQPQEATAESPAPGILAVHGYINSRETQSGFAIEFARRGYVVLALDQTGHGFSDPPAFAEGFGGPAALAWLKAQPFVDPARIGLEGHSMGGWTVQMAAASDPDGYTAMVLEGSSTGTFGAPAGTDESPRNVAVVFSLFDEFSGLMWEAAVPADIVDSPKLKALFGTADAVVPGEIYGDVARGNARRLTMPAVTHPGDHLSREAIGDALSWFDKTIGDPIPRTASDQLWYYKELGTLLILVGIVLLAAGLVQFLTSLQAPLPAPGMDPNEQPVPVRQYLGNLALLAVIPVITFFPLQMLGDAIFAPGAWFPQQITNGILVWAIGNGVITLALLTPWLRHQWQGAGVAVLPMTLPAFAKAAQISGLVFVLVYGVVVLLDWLLQVDPRFWVVALKPMTTLQFGAFLVYLPFFGVFFLTLALALHGRAPDRGGRYPGWINGAVLAGGFLVMLVCQYVPLLLGGTLLLASQPLLTIVALQFVPVLMVVGILSTLCFERTGNIWASAILNALLVTWYMVAGTAMQAVPFWG